MGGYEKGWSGVEVENLIARRCPLAPLIEKAVLVTNQATTRTGEKCSKAWTISAK